MKLENFFDKNKLEELLIANWTQYLNSSKLLAFLIHTVNENYKSFVVLPLDEIKVKGISMTVSRFSIDNSGYVLWVDFHVPINNAEIAQGTMEICITHNMNISSIEMSGNLFSNKF